MKNECAKRERVMKCSKPSLNKTIIVFEGLSDIGRRRSMVGGGETARMRTETARPQPDHSSLEAGTYYVLKGQFCQKNFQIDCNLTVLSQKETIPSHQELTNSCVPFYESVPPKPVC